MISSITWQALCFRDLYALNKWKYERAEFYDHERYMQFISQIQAGHEQQCPEKSLIYTAAGTNQCASPKTILLKLGKELSRGEVISEIPVVFKAPDIIWDDTSIDCLATVNRIRMLPANRVAELKERFKKILDPEVFEFIFSS